MRKGRKFVCYEPPYNGRILTRKQWKFEYKKIGNKEEYPRFEGWFLENLRCKNLIERQVKRNEKEVFLGYISVR